MGRKPQRQPEPVVWVDRATGGRVYYHSTPRCPRVERPVRERRIMSAIYTCGAYPCPACRGKEAM